MFRKGNDATGDKIQPEGERANNGSRKKSPEPERRPRWRRSGRRCSSQQSRIVRWKGGTQEKTTVKKFEPEQELDAGSGRPQIGRKIKVLKHLEELEDVIVHGPETSLQKSGRSPTLPEASPRSARSSKSTHYGHCCAAGEPFPGTQKRSSLGKTFSSCALF